MCVRVSPVDLHLHQAVDIVLDFMCQTRLTYSLLQPMEIQDTMSDHCKNVQLANLEKLDKRKEKGTIHGSGDDR